MKRKRNFVVYFSALLIGISMFSSCSKLKESQKYGGTFSFAMTNEPKTFLARNDGDYYSSTLLNQIYEGLVGLNPKNLKVEPALAKSWTVSKDGKTIKFNLRDDVYFQTDKKLKGKIKLKPSDVVFSIELACQPYQGKESYAYTSIYKNLLQGANDFYNQKADHISGISVDGNTITLKLVKKDINFLSKMALTPAAILSEKIVKAGLETDLIGTGPFCFDGYKNKDGKTQIILTRNDHYWRKDKDGNALPYLDKIVFNIIGDQIEQWKMFENGKLQLIDGLPPSKISEMLGAGKIKDFNGVPPKDILIRKPILGTQYYLFNCQKSPFDNKLVRQAFNYAVNRKYIVQEILNNQAYSIGDAGIVPPAGFKGYNTNEVKKHCYSYQPEKAKKLLAEAGYPNGKGFPTTSIQYNMVSQNYKVANEISMQLKNVLNVNVNLDGESFDQLINNQYYGKGTIMRAGWVADYASPENFLILGYGKSIPKDSTAPSKINPSRYYNPKFDDLLDQAKSTEDIVERYKYFEKAESILMDDSPFMILWYEETIKIVHSNVRNLRFNTRDFYIFRDVYLKNWTKKRWEERIQGKK